MECAWHGSARWGYSLTAYPLVTQLAEVDHLGFQKMAGVLTTEYPGRSFCRRQQYDSEQGIRPLWTAHPWAHFGHNLLRFSVI